MSTANLIWRLAEHLNSEGWEGGHVKGAMAGGFRRWVDDDHYVTVSLNNRYLKSSRKFSAGMHSFGVGLTHSGVMALFNKLFGDQGDYQPFVAASIESFGAPKWFCDVGYESEHCEHVEFDEVMRLIDAAHEDLVANHLGLAGLRSGVEKWNHPGTKPFELHTLDAYEGWDRDAAQRLASLKDDLNFSEFHANLADHLGYDPLHPPEG